MGVSPKIAPSMLSSDFSNLAAEANRMIDLGANWLHMDIMAFCPESHDWCSCHPEFEKAHRVTLSHSLLPLLELISLFRRLKPLSSSHSAYLDCHLMVTNPMDYVQHMATAGASGFTFHVEVAKENWQELVSKIKSAGMRPGVALKPGTPVEHVYPLVEGTSPVEMVLVMTVEPGFGGQKFMPDMMDKVRALRDKYPSLDIQVDGGLGPLTIDAAAAAGANCIVAGSSVFGAPEPGDVISLLRTTVEKAHPTWALRE